MRAASYSKKKKVTITRRQINTGFIVTVLSNCWLSVTTAIQNGVVVESEERSRWPSARGLSDVAETCDAGVTWRGS